MCDVDIGAFEREREAEGAVEVACLNAKHNVFKARTYRS